METSTVTPPPAPTPTGTAQGGNLGIKERRTWKTYQVVIFCGLTLLMGMRIGYDGNSETTVSSGGPANGVSGLPPDPGATASTPAPADADDPGATVTPGDPSEGDLETGRGADTDGSPGAEGSPAAAAAGGVPQVILELTPRTGSFTSEAFSVAPGAWKLGWSFSCQKQGGTGLFAISLQRPGGEVVGTDPAIDRDGDQGTGVEEMASDGEHVIVVSTECLWAVKVTGVPSP